MKLFAQLLILFFFTYSLLRSLRADIEGLPARRPGGFVDACASMVAIGILFAIFYLAGAFSEIKF